MKKLHLSLLFIIGLLVTTLVGCGGVGTATDGSEVAIEKATIKFVNDTIEGGYNLLSVDELNDWIKEEKEMIIIDTMPADSYEKGRIPGALNAELPMTTVEDATAEQKEKFISLLGEDKDTPIVVYCGFVGCPRSHVGGVIAMEEGFKNVYRVPGGIVAWKEAGYDVEK